MGQTAKEQTDAATWSELCKDLERMGLNQSEGMEISKVTGTVAQARGYSPEQVMAGLLEGVTQGALTITGDTVKFRK